MKPTIQRFSLLFLLLSTFLPALAQHWESLGPKDIDDNKASDGYGWNACHVTDKANNHYVAYQNLTYNRKLTVKKYNAIKKQWNFLGPETITEQSVDQISIVVTSTGILYVAYTDVAANYKVKVIRYENEQWISAGEGYVSNGTVSYLKLQISGSDEIYMAYSENSENFSINLKQFINDSWILKKDKIKRMMNSKLEFALDSDGIPYLGYTDSDNKSFLTRVIRLNNSSNSWDTIPSTGDLYQLYDDIYFSFTPQNELLVGYLSDGNMTVSQYSNAGWTRLGQKNSIAQPRYLSFAVSPSGIPYVVYQNNVDGQNLGIRIYNGYEWVDMHKTTIPTGLAMFTSISFVNDNPVISMMHNNNRIRFYQYDGVKWDLIGKDITGIAPAGSNLAKVASGPDNIPYLLTFDEAGNKAIHVTKFVNGEWQNVGTPGFAILNNYFNCAFGIDNDNTPIVIYQDPYKGNKAIAIKYTNNQWVSIGSDGAISDQQAYYYTLHIDQFNNYYVAYVDEANGRRVTAKKFNGTEWIIMGNPGFSKGEVSKVGFAEAPDKSLYIAYRDYSNNSRITLKKYNGSDWELIGTDGFGNNGDPAHACTHEFGFLIDLQNRPIIAYPDPSYNNSISIFRYEESNWNVLGNQGISPHTNPFYPAMNFIGDTLILTFQDRNNENTTGPTLARYLNTSSSQWEVLGEEETVSAGWGGNPTMTVTKDGSVLVGYVFTTGAYVKQLKLKTDNVTLIKNKKNLSNIVLYPNPSTGNFQITSKSKINSIKLIDVYGREEFYTGNEISTEMKGVITVIIDTEKGAYLNKVVIQ